MREARVATAASIDRTAALPATPTSERTFMRHNHFALALLLLLLLFVQSAMAQTVEPPSSDADSTKELAKHLNNPVADLWSLTFQYNHYLYKGPPADSTQTMDLLNFQPVLPIHLTSDWNLITRPVFPFVFNSPAFEPSEGWSDTNGFGDLTVLSILSPANLSSGFIWGVGPTAIFPTATNDFLGAGKYQAGPAAVGLYMGKDWVFGAVAQQWWSFAGDGDRQSTSSANIQYFIQYLFGDGWQIGMQPNILIDWKADQDNRFTVPVGFGIGKVVKIGSLPIKFTAEVDYMAIHPDDFGQHWGFRFQIIPVFPALFKDTLF
jgi:hypothetical protein